MNDTTEAFKSAMLDAGLTPPNEIIGDGKIRRFGTNGKRNDTAGWYILHLDGLPAGCFGNWRDGVGRTEYWCSVNKKEQTPAQRKEYAELMRAMRNERDRDTKERQDSAAKTAAKIWAEAIPATDTSQHAYLVKKGIKPHGARLIASLQARELCPFGDLSPSLAGPLLVIPKINKAGDLRSLQFIAEDGTKRPLTGGESKGLFYPIGQSLTAPARAVNIVCEGFATGASIHEATDVPTMVAFDCGNLGTVGKALRKQDPDAALLFAADDDHMTKGNPGLTSATAAALAVGGIVVAPIFPADRPDGATDFNDLHQLPGAGLDAVRACFAGAIDSVAATAQQTGAISQIEQNSDLVQDDAPAQAVGSEPPATGATFNPFADDAGPSEKDTGIFPPIGDRPDYFVLDDWAEDANGRHKPGAYYCGVKIDKQTGEPLATFETWFSSPLHVDAITFDGQSNNFGYLLRFKNAIGQWREWAMPMELLAGDGVPLRAELLAMGVRLDPDMAKHHLPKYLQWREPKRRMHCALQVGWCGDSFVLPDKVIGPRAMDVVFQSGERGHHEHTQAGTLGGWREHIAAKAVGNPLLMLALSASFAGPLLARCNGESGGIHFFGDSGTGKSTLADAAAATWGGANFRRSWKATANGVEGAAQMFNDCLFILDEISECEPKHIGDIVYSLGNGIGKQRAGKSGAARGVAHWRCFVLSNGEKTIATAMSEGGYRAKAGQSVRLLDIPVARQFGAWDNLHGAESPAAFSDALKRSALKHHGHAGRAFLEKLTRDTADYCAELDKIKALPLFATDGTDGQPKRAAARFALAGMAGELATEYGITGWAAGDAVKAAGQAFRLWLTERGASVRGNAERWQIAEQVQGFIERHGDGRFSDIAYTGDVQTRDRAGWWRDTDDGREYLFTRDGMREALKGFDFKRALDTLQESGALPAPSASGERARFFRIKEKHDGKGHGFKLYPIDPSKLL